LWQYIQRQIENVRFGSKADTIQTVPMSPLLAKSGH